VQAYAAAFIARITLGNAQTVESAAQQAET